MNTSPHEFVTVQSRIAVSWASAEVQQIHLPSALESTLPASADCRLDLCLTPRPSDAGLSFAQHWPRHRFERPGKLYLVPPCETVRARSSAGTQAAVICHLNPAGFAEWIGGGFEWSRERLEAGLDIHNGALRRLMLQLGQEARHPGFASEAMCEAIFMQIAIELGRHFRAIGETDSTTALAAWQLRLIDERLEELSEPPTLGALAALCGISVRHLTRGFRGSRGCSVGEYIAARRIEIAKRLLSEGESVDRAAHRLGFASRSSFSHAFRRAAGIAPGQFRQIQASQRSLHRS